MRKIIENPELIRLLDQKEFSQISDEVVVLEHGCQLQYSVNWNRTILITQGNESEESLQVALEHGVHHVVHHVVHQGNPSFVQSIMRAAVMLDDKEMFMKSPWPFIVGPSAFPIWRYGFHSSTEKTQLLESLEEHLKTFKMRSFIHESLLAVADELFTNVIYNAPMKKLGIKEPIFRGKFELPEPYKAEMLCCLDDKMVYISCHDPFGSLNVQNFLMRILKVHVEGPGIVMNRGRGGAGIGCHIMFELSSNIFIIVDKDQFTHIILGMPYTLSQKSKLQVPKCLHYIEN